MIFKPIERKIIDCKEKNNPKEVRKDERKKKDIDLVDQMKTTK